jgi:hypothetical protein
MIKSLDLGELGDGTCQICCDTTDKAEIVNILRRARLEVKEDYAPVFSETPKFELERVSNQPTKAKRTKSSIVVYGSYDDVFFALSCKVKLVRQHPNK